MSFPKQSDINEPLLTYIYEHGGDKYEVYPKDTYRPLAVHFKLSKEDLSVLRGGGKNEPQWHNMVQWARNDLLKGDLLEKGIRGRWRLSQKGIIRARELGKNIPIKWRTAHEDIEAERQGFELLSETERQQIIDARIGQGKYRDDLVKIWGSCSVTGFNILPLLRASHIKPWRECTNEDRVSPYNGLLLSPDLDAAFDCGIITFSKEGRIMISQYYQIEQLAIIGIKDNLNLRFLQSESEKYLEYHRNNVWLDRPHNPHKAETQNKPPKR
ncbi:HNH endonuclease [Nitrosomonas oligotropha]|uniref:HNH endonuclease n=1 Tax=Nitrosomonas oligotropha TaxID=42354 RepID=A0A2T5HXF1_9PROT|nr:winged helix-turn-helix domain-containing protein [Nitrosomonas oligotropha]PTQ76260.1 HNH endonuclease [Nitrosomonas oligotropha]